MTPIQDLEIENFRCFKKLSVKGLTRVNLFVGANDSGKSALLEAIEWFASGASPRRLWDGLNRRGARLDEVIEGEERVWDAASLFFGRNAVVPAVKKGESGNWFEVRTNSERARAEVDISENTFGLSCSFQGDTQTWVPLVARRGISSRSRKAVRDNAYFPLKDAANVVYVPAGIPRAKVLGRLWKSIVATDFEDRVNECARLADDRIERVAVGSGNLEEVEYGGVYLRLKGQPGRFSLSEFGDGLKRLIGMSAALAVASGGTLLIDEMDDGLYHAVLPDFWRFLVKTARQLDTQIFATTHSKDCIDAIAALYRDEKDRELTSDITVHRLELGKPEPVRMDARIISLATEGSQEVR